MLKEATAQNRAAERGRLVCVGGGQGVVLVLVSSCTNLIFIFNTVLFYIYYLNTVTILYLALEAEPSTPSLLQIRENRTIFLKLMFCIGLKAVPSILRLDD